MRLECEFSHWLLHVRNWNGCSIKQESEKHKREVSCNGIKIWRIWHILNCTASKFAESRKEDFDDSIITFMFANECYFLNYYSDLTLYWIVC